MIAAAPVAAADLPSLVHAGRWEEVRRATVLQPAPLAPSVALAAAVAERHMGRPGRALALLDAALPRAGDLAPALRLEASEAALALGRDPWPHLQSLLRWRAPRDQRRLATALLRRAWHELPVERLAAYRRRRLSRALRREVDAIAAIRSGARARASSLLHQRDDDGPALELARWLAEQDRIAPAARLDVAATLLARGWWREADGILAALPLPATRADRFRLAYLRARAAYRLGRFAEAGRRYAAALALAPDDAARFDVSVQRARVAEVLVDWPAALEFWREARAAGPREVEGWDGTCRLLATLHRGDEAVDLLQRAPPSARRVFAPRLVATLLAHGRTDLAAAAMRHAPASAPAVRAMRVALAASLGGREAATAAAVDLLTDRRAGAWRELALAMLPPAGSTKTVVPEASLDPLRLAEMAVARGAPCARRALQAALAEDPQWAALLGGADLPQPELAPPLAALVEVGFEGMAAGVFAHLFPAASPADLAWSARHLAAWGNLPAALAFGEKLWDRLGVPAVLLPDSLLPRVIPDELVSACVTAAHAASFRADWLAAIVRRESRFRERASSEAGALGIAQVVPETSRRLGADPEDAFDPATALALAAGEAQRLATVFQGRLVPLAAAYNAGEPVVTAWLHQLGENATEPLLAAAIPYGETSRYVLAVTEGAMLCRHLRPPGAPLPGELPATPWAAEGPGGDRSQPR